MAKIQLVIDADGPEDLANTLSSLMYLSAYRADEVPRKLTAALGTAGDAQYLDTVDKGAPEKSKQGRKPKADASPATSDAGNGVGTSGQADQGSAGSGQTATTGASLSDQVKQAAAEVEADQTKAGGPSEADLKAAMTAHMGKHSAVKTQATLEAAVGAKRISEIPAEKYAEAIAALEAEL